MTLNDTDDSEAALIKKVQGHAKENHGMEFTEEKARSLFKEPAKK